MLQTDLNKYLRHLFTQNCTKLLSTKYNKLLVATITQNCMLRCVMVAAVSNNNGGYYTLTWRDMLLIGTKIIVIMQSAEQ